MQSGQGGSPRVKGDSEIQQQQARDASDGLGRAAFEMETRPFLDEGSTPRQRSPQRSRHKQRSAVYETDLRKDACLGPGQSKGTPWPLSWFSSHKNTTSVLVNLSAIMERTDEQLLPAVYIFVAASFNATPEQLGYLTLSRALVQAVSSPLGGFLGINPCLLYLVLPDGGIGGLVVAG